MLCMSCYNFKTLINVLMSVNHSRFSFRPHITKLCNKAKFVLNRLFWLINKRSKMLLRHKLTLYKTCIRPIMSRTLSQIPFRQYRINSDVSHRVAPGQYVTSTYIEILNWPSINEHCKHLATRYFERAGSHANPPQRAP